LSKRRAVSLLLLSYLLTELLKIMKVLPFWTTVDMLFIPFSKHHVFRCRLFWL